MFIGHWTVHVHDIHNVHKVYNVHNAVDQENGCGGEDGSAGSGLNSAGGGLNSAGSSLNSAAGGGLKELDPSQERRRCSRVRFMKQVFLVSISSSDN